MLEEKRETAGSNWTLAYDFFEPEEEALREALTSTGNGYFCTRGALGWSETDEVSYPGTYTHGGYNRETTIMAGVPVLNEDLVNLPNWLLLELRIEGEEALDMSNVELLSYRHEYDARYALLKRIATLRDRAGRKRSAHSDAFPQERRVLPPNARCAPVSPCTRRNRARS